MPGRHRRVRPGDAGQRPRVPRRVFRVLRVRRGAVQGRLLRRAGRRGLLPAGLRAAQAPGHVRAGAHVQPAQGRRPPLAVRAQGPAPEEEERAAAVARGRGRVQQRAHRAQRAEDTAVDVGQVTIIYLICFGVYYYYLCIMLCILDTLFSLKIININIIYIYIYISFVRMSVIILYTSEGVQKRLRTCAVVYCIYVFAVNP